MTTSQNEEKPYDAYHISWNNDYEDYEYEHPVIWDGEPLKFNTYSEFLEFMAGLTTDEKIGLGLWRLEDDRTGEILTINDGEFDEVSFLSLNAAKNEPPK